MLPDVGQMGKEKGESHEWALMLMLPVQILAELYPMTSTLIQIKIFSIDIHVYSGRLD